MGRKRPRRNRPTIWWSLTVVAAALLAWLIWQNTQNSSGQKSASSTNRLDVARATNLLHWLNTNFVAPPTNLATRPVVPPITNQIPTNRVPLRITNLNLVATNRPATNLLTAPPPMTPAAPERPVRNFLEAQIALARLAISSGPIDGVVGYQTRAALRAFQLQNDLPPSSDLDPATSKALTISEPIFTNYAITPVDLARLRPVPATWMEKSEQEALEYETALELVAERHQASHNLLKSLNPWINWTNVSPFTVVKVPNVPRPAAKQRAAFIRIQLAAKVLEAFDAETNLLAHFPCSIASRVEKRPAGQLTVVTGAENPNYTFDPAVFPESEEARHIDHKLIIPPGPNNPVGTAWISLDKPGYGIHGTPRPDQVGRTESHGCFRLANWNAEYLLKIVWSGLPVYVEP